MKMKALSICIGLLFSLASWSLRAAPANDNFANAYVLTGVSVTRIDSNVGATRESGEPYHDESSPLKSIWYRWTAPQDGILTISTAGSTFDTVLAVYTGTTLLNLVRVASNDDDGSLMTSKVRFAARAGTTYRIAVDGYFGDFGTVSFSLNLQTNITKPANDNYANATLLVGATININAGNDFATVEPNELTPTLDGGASVWWAWDAPSSERYLIKTLGSDFDTILAVYNGTTLVSWNDDDEDSTSALHFNTQQGTRYYFSVLGYKGDTGLIHLSLQPDPPKPAPAWTLVDIYGRTRRSTDYAGKVVILDFWATWCGPCVAEIPTLIDMQQEYGDDGLVIIGVSVDDTGAQAVIPFVLNNPVNYTETISTSKIESDYGGIPFIPSTFIIDRNNLIAEHFVGEQSRAAFDDVLLPLLYPPTSVLLDVSRDGDFFVLKWPVAATGYSLQSATDVTLPSNWTAFSAQVSVVGSLNVARVPIGDSKRWFRLRHN